MRGLHWLVGAAALVAFDAALVWGVRYWQAHSVPDVPRPSLERVAVPGPPPRPAQVACVNGALWVFQESQRIWVMPKRDGKPVACR